MNGAPGNHEHSSDDRLVDLVLGLLPREAANVTREHARRCPACADRLRLIAASHARATSRAASFLADPEASVAPEALPPRSIRPVPRRRAAFAGPWRWLPIAAALAIALGAALLNRPAQWTREPGPLPTPETAGITRAADAPPADSIVSEGLAAFAGGDYRRAEGLLRSTSVSGPVEQARRIYLGRVLLDRGEAKEAAEILSGVDRTIVAEPWRSEAQWMLAQSLARSGRRAGADSVLRELARIPNRAGERARRALR
jgi:hypothetical protein